MLHDRVLENFRIERDERGVVTAWLDVPDRPVNVFDEAVMRELFWLIEQLEHEPGVRATIFRSAKASGFLAGADVSRIQTIATREEAETTSGLGQQVFDRLQHLPMPTVAVIHGPCLGGGLEFALACRYRVACDDAKTRLGLPEIELGLLPGWGGTQRLPRLIGLASSLRMILEAKKLSGREAVKWGLADAAAAPDQLNAEVEHLVSRLLAGHAPARKRPTLTALLRDHTRLGQWLVFRTVRNKLNARGGRHYPALAQALESVRRGLQGPRAQGFAFERRAFSELLFTPTCRSLIGLFFQRERARNPMTWMRSADSAVEAQPVRRLAVIGGGVMGAGIAQLAAFQGLDVVLKEVNQELLDGGMRRIRELLDESVSKKSLRAEEADARFQAITPTVDWDKVAQADVAVEAVTEKEQIKLQVFRELDQRLPAGAVLASNTSALSIQHLADATQRPAQVAGLHFFNPVHRMHLVEVVRGPATNDETLATLVGLVRKLGKTPVVVADSPGFLVNRILFPYLAEAVRLSCDGFATEEIDREMRRFGMPMGPLELIDQAGLDIAVDVSRTLAAFIPDPGPAADRLLGMVQRGWLGKKSGRGFYEYKHGKKGRSTVFDQETGAVRPAVSETGKDGARKSTVTAGTREDTLSPESLSVIQRRLVCLLINESSRCLGEQIVDEPWMVDLAMVLGTGFAPFRGGPLRVADEWSIPVLVGELERLEQEYGPRFAPSTTLRQMREQGSSFHSTTENWKAVAKTL